MPNSIDEIKLLSQKCKAMARHDDVGGRNSDFQNSDKSMNSKVRLFLSRIGGYRIVMAVTIIVISTVIFLMLMSYPTGWKFTGIVNGTQCKTLWEWVDLLFVPAAIAIVSAFFAKSQQRNNWTIKIRDEYDKQYKTLAAFYGYIETKTKPSSKKKENEMKTLVNWMETVATLYNHHYLNRNLILALGLDKEICEFYCSAIKAPFFEEAVDGSKELIKFCNMRLNKNDN